MSPKEYTGYVRNNPRQAAYPPAFLRTHVPTEEITDRVEAWSNPLSLFYLTIRRLPTDKARGTGSVLHTMLGTALEMI